MRYDVWVSYVHNKCHEATICLSVCPNWPEVKVLPTGERYADSGVGADIGSRDYSNRWFKVSIHLSVCL